MPMFDTKAGDAFSMLWHSKKKNMSLGIIVTLPFGNLTAVFCTRP